MYLPRIARQGAHPECSNDAHLCPSHVADRELEWFFTMAESDMGARSNYMDMLVPQCQRGHHDTDLVRRIGARTAQRTIHAWLVRIEGAGGPHAGVLKAAYQVRSWPAPLVRCLGRLTGIAVRLETAEAGLPDDDAELDARERWTAERLARTLSSHGPPGLERLRAGASERYELALRAYERERGDGPCVVGRWSCP